MPPAWPSILNQMFPLQLLFSPLDGFGNTLTSMALLAFTECMPVHAETTSAIKAGEVHLFVFEIQKGEQIPGFALFSFLSTQKTMLSLKTHFLVKNYSFFLFDCGSFFATFDPNC
jgi:hypothetical protein